MVGQWRRSITSDCPRNRATSSNTMPAMLTETARKVHTETSRTAIGKSGQVVPQTSVRTRSRTSARGGMVGCCCIGGEGSSEALLLADAVT